MKHFSHNQCLNSKKQYFKNSTNYIYNCKKDANSTLIKSKKCDNTAFMITKLSICLIPLDRHAVNADFLPKRIYVWMLYDVRELTSEWYPKELVNDPKVETMCPGNPVLPLKTVDRFACPCQTRNLRDPPTISASGIKKKKKIHFVSHVQESHFFIVLSPKYCLWRKKVYPQTWIIKSTEF